MKKTNKKRISRWGILAIVAVLILLLAGSAIYAQGFRPHRDMQGGRGQGMMGPGQGQRGGPGMRGDRGQGPGAMFGMQFMIQDPEIMDIMMQIKIIEGLNRLELTPDQVALLRDAAVEAQDIVNGEFSGVRDQIRDGLNQQLDVVLSGGESDPEFIRGIIEGAREQHDRGAARERLEGILERVTGLFTEEQREAMMREAGPGQEMRGRMQEWQGDVGGGREWFRNLDDEQREQVEQRIREQRGDVAAGAAKMKLMMLLLSPQSVEAMDLWLEAN